MIERIALSATPFNWCTCGGQSANDVSGGRAPRIDECIEGSDEFAHLRCRFVLVLQQVHRLKARVVIHQDEGVLACTVDGLHEGPGDVHRSPECGRRAAFASRQAEHDGVWEWIRLEGASAAREGSALIRAGPACKRRCIQRAASFADMTWMCDEARLECMANARATREAVGALATCHS
eukprot:1907715-Pleurochrysis_carterae.AAC.1